MDIWAHVIRGRETVAQGPRSYDGVAADVLEGACSLKGFAAR